MYPVVETSGHMSKGKAIHFIPSTPELGERIETHANTLRVSKNGFVNLACEVFLPLIESGEAQVINGRVVVSKPRRKAA